MGVIGLLGQAWRGTLRARFQAKTTRIRIAAAMEQAVFSGTNFGLTLMLVFTGNLAELGRYALVSSISTLSLGIMQAVSVDPMTVFFSDDLSPKQRQSIETLICRICIGLLVVSASFLAIAGWDIQSTGQVFALGLSLAAMQLLVIARKRAFYIDGAVPSAVRISVLYMLGALGWAAIATTLHYPPSTIFIASCMLCGSFAASSVWSVRAATRADTEKGFPNGWFKYSSSSLSVSVVSSIGLQGFYWIGARTAGLEVVGVVKAAEQVMLPITFILTMLGLPDMVQSSQDYSRGDVFAVRSRYRRRSAQFAVAAAGYVSLVVGGLWLVGTIWRPPRGQGVLELSVAAAFGACVLLQAVSLPRLTALRAVRSPHWILLAYLAMAVVVMGVGASLRPLTAIGVISILAVGWFLNLAALQYGVRQSLP